MVELGFSSNLVSTLASSREKLDIYIDKIMEKADAAYESTAHLSQERQSEMDVLVSKLQQLQLERGTSESKNNLVLNKKRNPSHPSIGGIAAKRRELRERQNLIEEEKCEIEQDVEEARTKLNETIKEGSIYRIKAEEARRKKMLVKEAKQTTIDDLTRGVLYYNKLGLDFERAGNRLRFNFTQVDHDDPKRGFSFALDVNENDIYEVDECNPPLRASTITSLIDALNTSGNTNPDFSTFVRGMRNAFKATL